MDKRDGSFSASVGVGTEEDVMEAIMRSRCGGAIILEDDNSVSPCMGPCEGCPEAELLRSSRVHRAAERAWSRMAKLNDRARAKAVAREVGAAMTATMLNARIEDPHGEFRKALAQRDERIERLEYRKAELEQELEVARSIYTGLKAGHEEMRVDLLAAVQRASVAHNMLTSEQRRAENLSRALGIVLEDMRSPLGLNSDVRDFIVSRLDSEGFNANGYRLGPRSGPKPLSFFREQEEERLRRNRQYEQARNAGGAE